MNDRLFNLDNPVFQVLNRLVDLIILGLLCLVCCLPVVTIGPAVTALFKTVYDLTLERNKGLVKNYFRAFRDNWKQALKGWLLALLGLASLVCDWLLLRLYFQGTVYTVLSCMVLLLVLILLGLLCYLFPLISRYSNTFWEHVRNALILEIRYFPKTLLMVLLQLLPLLMFTFMPYVLITTLLFWILLFPGGVMQANAYLIRPIFGKLESEEEEDEGQEEDEEELDEDEDDFDDEDEDTEDEDSEE